MSDAGRAAIDDFYLEERVFPPPEGFVDQAVVADRSMFEQAGADMEGFWAEQAEALDWFQKWHTVLEWEPPFARWFVGWHPQRLGQLPRPPRGSRARPARGAALGGRAG